MKRLPILVLVAACGSHPSQSHEDASSPGDGTDPDGGEQTTDGAAPATDAPLPDAAIPDAPYMPADPFTPDGCTPITFAELVTRFSPGSVTAGAGAFTLTSRARAACNEITGCSPWVAPSPVRLQQIFARGGYAQGATHAMPATGAATLLLETSSPAKIKLEFVATEPGAASLTIRFRCEHVPQGGSASSLDCSTQVEFPNDYPSLLWFVDTYAGRPLFDNTTMVSWRGTICSDGRYQLVTKLATDLGTMVSGANNRSQLAIYGQL